MIFDREPFLIAGGGIGGLALALALAARRVPSLVLERQEEIAAAGAGIQIGPNGVRVLQAIGVADALHSWVGEPETIVIHAGSSGRVLNRLPLGGWIAGRYGAPYWVVHRGDLHRVLLDAAASHPLITIRRGFEVSTVQQSTTHVTASDRAESVSGCALIGADGVWSAVRQAMPGMPVPQFAGATATRTVIPAANAGSLAMRSVGLWLNPHAHVVHYPVRGGREIAVVIIARESWESRDWDAHADPATIAEQLRGFDARLVDLLRTVPRWRKWALYTLAPLPRWIDGRIALLGDAAHPMLPYLAQGGAFAMEDALTLAACVAPTADIPQALSTYAEMRCERAQRVQAASVRQGQIYRLGPPLSPFRDIVLQLSPGALLMRRLDWLYRWSPPQ